MPGVPPLDPSLTCNSSSEKVMLSQTSVSHSVQGGGDTVSLVPCSFLGRVSLCSMSLLGDRVSRCIWGWGRVSRVRVSGDRVSGGYGIQGVGYMGAVGFLGIQHTSPETTKAGGMHPTGVLSCNVYKRLAVSRTTELEFEAIFLTLLSDGSLVVNGPQHEEQTLKNYDIATGRKLQEVSLDFEPLGMTSVNLGDRAALAFSYK